MAEENPYEAPLIQPQARPDLPSDWRARGPVQNRSPRQWQAIVRQRVRRGELLRQIRDDVIQEGLPPERADVLLRQEQVAYRKSGMIVAAVGLGLTVLGIGATAVSFLDAAPHGRDYVIWWGPVVFGVIVLITGLLRLARASRN